MQRRERTRHLIELGGLVQKASLVDLTGDDRATIYGALLETVGKARGEADGDTLALWRRRGRRAFAIEDNTGDGAIGLTTGAPHLMNARPNLANVAALFFVS